MFEKGYRMPYISQSKAAKLADVSRGTIANRINEGVLSRTPEGIDVAELVRVFPDIPADRIEQFLAVERGPDTSSTERTTDAGYLSRLEEADRNAAWLRELVEQRDQTIAQKERQLEQAQARLDEREAFWTRQVTQLQALLPAPAPAPRKRFLGLF